ncbi:MAG: dockerin type I domain-containing protein [Phycisphaerales bacterium]
MVTMKAKLAFGLLALSHTSTSGAAAQGYKVQLHLQAIVWTTPQHPNPRYLLWPHLNVYGLTSYLHPANRATVVSGSGLFADDILWPAISPEFETFESLREAIENSGTWRIDVFDGATNTSASYAFSVSADMLSSNHLRPVEITSIASGGSISQQPTFTWAIAPDNPSEPMLHTNAVEALIKGPTEVRRWVPFPTRAWTSPQHLVAGTYRFYVTMDRSRTEGVTILTTSTPIAQGGSPPLLDFSHYSYAYSGAVVVNLNAGSTLDCLGDFNQDRRTDAVDLMTLISFFGATVPYGFPSDINLDGVVNTADLTAFLRRFGESCR